MAVLEIARGQRVRLPVPAATVLVIGAVAASVAAAVVFLLQHPAAASNWSPARAATLAVALAGCVWLAVAPPRWFDSGHLAAYLGVGAAVINTLVGIAAARVDVEGLPAMLLLGGTVLTFVVPAFIAAAVGRSFRAGVQAGVWTAIAVMPLTYAAGLVNAIREHAANGEWTFAGGISSAGFTFTSSLVTVLIVAVLGFPFAALGATFGALCRSTPLTPDAVPKTMP